MEMIWYRPERGRGKYSHDDGDVFAALATRMMPNKIPAEGFGPFLETPDQTDQIEEAWEIDEGNGFIILIWDFCTMEVGAINDMCRELVPLLVATPYFVPMYSAKFSPNSLAFGPSAYLPDLKTSATALISSSSVTGLETLINFLSLVILSYN